MDELNTKTHSFDHSHDVASIDLEQLLTASMPREKLLPLVKEMVKLVIAQFIEHAPIATATGDVVASANVLDYLRSASAIPLPPELCTLMARVGFDKALFTYGSAQGIPVGYAEGLWLLKFVGLTENDPARLQNAPWIKLLGKNATKH